MHGKLIIRVLRGGNVFIRVLQRVKWAHWRAPPGDLLVSVPSRVLSGGSVLLCVFKRGALVSSTNLPENAIRVRRRGESRAHVVHLSDGLDKFEALYPNLAMYVPTDLTA